MKQNLGDLLAQLRRKEEASSFSDRASAEGFIKAAVKSEEGAVAIWYQSQIKRRVLRHTTIIITGTGVTEQRTKLANYTGVLVVLERMTDCQIRIVTAYPKDEVPDPNEYR